MELKAMREADACVFKSTIKAKEAFSSSSFATPLDWSSKIEQPQVTQPLHDDSIASETQTAQPAQLSTHSIHQTARQLSQSDMDEPPTLITTTVEHTYQKSVNTTHTGFEKSSYVSSSTPSVGETIHTRKASWWNVDDYIKTKSKTIPPLSIEKLMAIASRSNKAGYQRLHTITNHMREVKRATISLKELQRQYARCVRSESLDLAPQTTPSRSTASSTEATTTTEEATEAVPKAAKATVDGSDHSTNEDSHSSTQTYKSASRIPKASNPEQDSAPSASNNRSNPLFGSTGSAATATNPLMTPTASAFAPAIQTTGFGKPSAPVCRSTKAESNSSQHDKATDDRNEDKYESTGAAGPELRMKRNLSSPPGANRKGKGPPDADYRNKVNESNHTYRPPLARTDGNIRKAPPISSATDTDFNIRGAAAAAAKPTPRAQRDVYAAAREGNQQKREQLKSRKQQAAPGQGPRPDLPAGRPGKKGGRKR